MNALKTLPEDFGVVAHIVVEKHATALQRVVLRSVGTSLMSKQASAPRRREMADGCVVSVAWFFFP